MHEDFPAKLRSFILRPAEAFKNVKDGNFRDAFLYYIILIVIYSVLSGIINYFRLDPVRESLNPALPVETVTYFDILSIFYGIVGWIVLFFLIGIILHPLILIVGGRKGIEQTFKSIAYASTPGFLLGWIPVIGIFFAFYGIFVQIIGISELHEISTKKAAFAAILLITLITGLTIIIGFFLLFAFLTAF
ncbi:YIP1 family protein [Methanoplanus endosymbiosus]|uniref:YIP1 family protein n=1 Tax=Methanoplanus endosymbiosus TaxID=33865 RepID=A0A9E7PN48_9EURY|nr:YIP1 family protein [Methanoplanus endosymbiosus]UUX92004.1 YIP1 family protein [Methanoplanus endosymbiosus]